MIRLHDFLPSGNAYTHVAGEGGFDLEPYPSVRAWLERVRGEPRHIAITHRP